MAHKWECWAGAWVIWIKLPGFQQFSLFLISQFYRQAFVLNPVNAQERLLKAHIWPQLGCSIKTSPSSSLQTDIPKAGAALGSLTVTQRQPHQAREAQHRQGGGTEQDSETFLKHGSAHGLSLVTSPGGLLLGDPIHRNNNVTGGVTQKPAVAFAGVREVCS